MAIILFDPPERSGLFPLTHLKAVSELRFGLFTIAGRWEKFTRSEVFTATEDYLQSLYKPLPKGIHTWVNAMALPDARLADAILNMKEGEVLRSGSAMVAVKADLEGKGRIWHENKRESLFPVSDVEVRWLRYPWQIFQQNDDWLRSDIEWLKNSRSFMEVPSHVQCTVRNDIFIEEGAVLEHVTLNATQGPIYISTGSVIMDGALIRGPFAALEGAVVKMGAKIYGATTLGPFCVVGGELKNVVMQQYSNKAHDGYLGDAVIGAWCNFGAGATGSNVKNTGAIVCMKDENTGDMVEAGMKCGLITGDYSRIAINGSLNTGTVIGTCCNVFGSGLLPRYIPSFTWGTDMPYRWEGALRDMNNWKKMKGQSVLPEEEKALLRLYRESNPG